MPRPGRLRDGGREADEGYRLPAKSSCTRWARSGTAAARGSQNCWLPATGARWSLRRARARVRSHFPPSAPACTAIPWMQQRKSPWRRCALQHGNSLASKKCCCAAFRQAIWRSTRAARLAAGLESAQVQTNGRSAWQGSTSTQGPRRGGRIRHAAPVGDPGKGRAYRHQVRLRRGAVGACSVHLNGQMVRSCSPSGRQPDGGTAWSPSKPVAQRQPRGAEGMAELDVPQCGYCQSGQIMAAASLLAKNRKPTDAHIDAAMTNVCRSRHLPAHPRRGAPRRGHARRQESLRRRP